MKVLIDVNYVSGRCGLGYTNKSIYVLSTCCGSSMTASISEEFATCDNCDYIYPNTGRWAASVSFEALAEISPRTASVWVEYWTGVENVEFHVSGLDS